MRRQANECCDIQYVVGSIYVWLVWGFSSCLIVLWQRWLLYEMLIISYVERCSKPTAISLYDFCVFVIVPACHSGFLEGYFSTMISMLFVQKYYERLWNWLGGQIHRMIKKSKRVEGKRWRGRGGDKKGEELLSDGEKKVGQSGWGL